MRKFLKVLKLNSNKWLEPFRNKPNRRKKRPKMKYNKLKRKISMN